MNTTVPKNLVTLARMLERLDRSAEPVDPQQYRGVVEHLSDVLRAMPHDAALEGCGRPARLSPGEDVRVCVAEPVSSGAIPGVGR